MSKPAAQDDAGRDAKLRAHMLTLARLKQAWLPASLLADKAYDVDGKPCDSDDHAGRLIDELLSWGLLEEEHNPHAANGVPRSIRHRRVKLTDKGWKLWMGDLPPMPGVWDERVEGA